MNNPCKKKRHPLNSGCFLFWYSLGRMTLEQFKKKMSKIPDGPGVYFFLDKRKKVLYIGKATSLRDRLRSYFAKDIAEVRSKLISNMVEAASSIDWRETDSVLEALILEANLIKTYKPKANTDAKDDKSWNYVVITKEDFPRVLLVRGKELEALRKSKASGKPKSSAEDFVTTAPSRLRTFLQPSFASLYTFGPFPHGMQLKEALKLVRKIFPYRDKCVPGKRKRCFDAQIGLCPGVCSGEITKQDYRKIIRHIVLLFEGKKKKLLTTLAREMRQAAKEEQFEEAKKLRAQIYALQHIQDVSLIKDEYRLTSNNSVRIEAYDMAHLQGSANVGVMVVVEDGEAKKSEYRKFTIKTATPGDDVGALREVLSRRMGHDEWPMPRLIVVDGSVAQMNGARKVLDEYGIKIPIVGVTKDEKHRPRALQGDQAVIRTREKEILLANAEAHRFAIGFHRKKMRSDL